MNKRNIITINLGIEERAKLYYISSGKKTEPEPEPDGGDEPAPSGDDTPSGDSDGGERLRVGDGTSGMVTPVTPE